MVMDLFVEVLDPEIEISRAKHIHNPRDLRFPRKGPSHAPAPTADHTLLASLLIGVPQSPEMTLAEIQKLTLLDAAQSSSMMRINRIQNMRHPNLRQHAVPRSKNLTNHVRPASSQSACCLIWTYHVPAIR